MAFILKPLSLQVEKPSEGKTLTYPYDEIRVKVIPDNGPGGELYKEGLGPNSLMSLVAMGSIKFDRLVKVEITEESIGPDKVLQTIDIIGEIATVTRSFVNHGGSYIFTANVAPDPASVDLTDQKKREEAAKKAEEDLKKAQEELRKAQAEADKAKDKAKEDATDAEEEAEAAQALAKIQAALKVAEAKLAEVLAKLEGAKQQGVPTPQPGGTAGSPPTATPAWPFPVGTPLPVTLVGPVQVLGLVEGLANVQGAVLNLTAATTMLSTTLASVALASQALGALKAVAPVMPQTP